MPHGLGPVVSAVVSALELSWSTGRSPETVCHAEQASASLGMNIGIQLSSVGKEAMHLTTTPPAFHRAASVQVPPGWNEGTLRCSGEGATDCPTGHLALFMHTYAHTHTHTHTHTCIYIHTYIHTYTHIYIYIYISVWTATKHAAACHSTPQHPVFGAADGGFEACRSMPQHQESSD